MTTITLFTQKPVLVNLNTKTRLFIPGNGYSKGKRTSFGFKLRDRLGVNVWSPPKPDVDSHGLEYFMNDYHGEPLSLSHHQKVRNIVCKNFNLDVNISHEPVPSVYIYSTDGQSQKTIVLNHRIDVDYVKVVMSFVGFVDLRIDEIKKTEYTDGTATTVFKGRMNRTNIPSNYLKMRIEDILKNI